MAVSVNSTFFLPMLKAGPHNDHSCVVLDWQNHFRHPLSYQGMFLPVAILPVVCAGDAANPNIKGAAFRQMNARLAWARCSFWLCQASADN